MKTPSMLLSALFTAAACSAAFAQDMTTPTAQMEEDMTAPAAQMEEDLTAPAAQMEDDMSAPAAQVEAQTGPVTVKSVQPPIGNASEYQVKVADIDANGDGVVSKKEVPTNHALYFEFKLVDTNRNGRVTDEELANWK